MAGANGFIGTLRGPPSYLPCSSYRAAKTPANKASLLRSLQHALTRRPPLRRGKGGTRARCLGSACPGLLLAYQPGHTHSAAPVHATRTGGLGPGRWCYVGAHASNVAKAGSVGGHARHTTGWGRLLPACLPAHARQPALQRNKGGLRDGPAKRNSGPGSAGLHAYLETVSNTNLQKQHVTRQKSSSNLQKQHPNSSSC